MLRAYERDGHTRVATWEDMRPGVVLRMVELEVGYVDGEIAAAFPDYLIVRAASDEQGVYQVKLVRPFVYSHLSETACGSALVGLSDLSVPASRLVNNPHWRVVLLSTGKPNEYKL